jgi:hypothetical protein
MVHGRTSIAIAAVTRKSSRVLKARGRTDAYQQQGEVGSCIPKSLVSYSQGPFPSPIPTSPHPQQLSGGPRRMRLEMMRVSTPVSHAGTKEKVSRENMRREEVGEAGFKSLVDILASGLVCRLQRHTTAPSQEISEV